MEKYKLSKHKMVEIQAVNAVRKDAIKNGISLDKAMSTQQTIDQIPEKYIIKKQDKENKENILDKCYNKIFKDEKENINHSPIEIKDIIQKEDSNE